MKRRNIDTMRASAQTRNTLGTISNFHAGERGACRTMPFDFRPFGSRGDDDDN